MEDDGDEDFQLTQLTLRLGRKRTLALLLQQADPVECQAVQGQPILQYITSVALLATLLSALWGETARIARVCKRFSAATQHPNFWMPAVRAAVRKQFPNYPPALLASVNPLYRFPKHMTMCPGWPWWRFLQWLFPRMGSARPMTMSGMNQTGDEANAVRASYRIALNAEDDALAFVLFEDGSLTTRWYPFPLSRNSAAILMCNYNEIPDTERSSYVQGYTVNVLGKVVWCDADMNDEGRRWCGAIEPRETGSREEAKYVKGQGFYRE